MDYNLNKKYIFDGAALDNSFFKTAEDKVKFLKDIRESTRDFIKEQAKRMAKSYATSQARIVP